MQERTKPTAPNTRQRILDAATRVFAQQGLEGATTREIAAVAKVNEVTLFRHFLNKEGLLEAVLQGTFEQQERAAIAAVPSGEEDGAGRVLPSLRECLSAFAQRYEELLRRNILLLRTLLGEIHRHREHEARMLRCIFAPLKADFVASIEQARELGAVRPEVEPMVAADLFSSAIFVNVLRRTLHSEPEYTTEHYLKSVADPMADRIDSRIVCLVVSERRLADCFALTGGHDDARQQHPRRG